MASAREPHSLTEHDLARTARPPAPTGKNQHFKPHLHTSNHPLGAPLLSLVSLDIAHMLAHTCLRVFGRAFLLEVLLPQGLPGCFGFVDESFARIRICLGACGSFGASVIAHVVLMWSGCCVRWCLLGLFRGPHMLKRVAACSNLLVLCIL